MKIVSSVIFDNEYKLLGTKSKKMVTALKYIENAIIYWIFKDLKRQ